MRERLIELIAEAVKDQAAQTWEEVADYLLDNGVIVLPCKVGDTVWRVDGVKWHGYDHKYPVWKDAWVVEMRFRYEDIPKVGKTVFLTKEEAEAKLAKLKGE